MVKFCCVTSVINAKNLFSPMVEQRPNEDAIPKDGKKHVLVSCIGINFGPKLELTIR